MSYRLLLDENFEHEVCSRLQDDGHDVEHVDFVSELGKGASDEELARYSIETDRIIVTYDDDFIGKLPSDQYRGVLFFQDDTVTAREVTNVITTMSEMYPHDRVRGLQKTGREWL